MEKTKKGKPISVNECKKISYKILLDVAKFCEKNNLRYFLACGTLLGAIRHKGFIPWDDDIDIMMPRPDFEVFLKTYKHENYDVCKPEDGRICFAKVYDNKTIKYEEGVDYNKNKPLGVDIDIFPLDGIVDDESVVNKNYKLECFLEMLLRLSNQPIFYRKNPLKAIFRIIPRIIGSKNIVKLIEKNAKRYSYDDSDYVVRMKRSLNGFTGALSKEVYDVAYCEFENNTFRIPIGYDEWLTKFFGDYMTLPPEEKRTPSHLANCYYIEEKNL